MPYKISIWAQSVSSARAASAWTAAIAACSWNGPTGPVGSARSTSSTPSLILARSQRDRSCSARGTSAPSRPSRAARRASVSSMSANNPVTSPAAGSRSCSWRVSRIASSASDHVDKSGPRRAGVALGEHQVEHVGGGRDPVGQLVRRPEPRTSPRPRRSRFFARLIRCAMVASGTRNARAICAVLKPATARNVSATWEGGGSAGWQHSSRSVSESSRSTSLASSAGGATQVFGRRTTSNVLLTVGSGLPAAPLIHQPARGDGDQPTLRVVRPPVVWPVLCGGEQRLLDRVLRGLEVAVAPDESGQHVRRTPAPDVCQAGIAH